MSHPKVIPFDQMWTYVGSRRKGKRNSVWVYGVWTAVVEDGYGSLWHGYDVVGSDEAALVKLYERMPDARLHSSDGYDARRWLPSDRRKAGKGGGVNKNLGGSVLRGKLNRLVRKTKRCSKSARILDASLALIWARQGWI